MSTTDEQRLAFDNDGPPYTLDGMDPLLRGLIVNAVHGAMATKAPPPANHWLTTSWEIGRAMTAAVSEPAAPVDARDAQRLNWLNDNGTKFTMTMRESDAFELEWLDDKGRNTLTKGADIRACIDAALARQAEAPAEGK